MDRLLVSLLLIGAWVGPAHTQERWPSPDALFEQAMPYFPTYTGEHRPFLTDEQRRGVSAGANILAAVLELDPDHLRALWWTGHAHVLLAEDRRSRGDDDAAAGHDARSIAAFTRAIELDPSDPWAYYARGTALTHTARHWRAAADLQLAVELADERMRAPGFADNLSWLRDKALAWRPEVLMRAHEFERAREELAAFHARFSSNSWPGLIARGESYLRERDFAGALETYDAVLGEYPEDHQAYALIGYVHGLLGDRERATHYLGEVVRREPTPGMYSRLWLALLATDERVAEAEADLRDFLANAPQSTSPWDLTLGRFAMGAGTADEFLAAAHAEEARRAEQAVALDDLMCETWFYVGLHHEAAGEVTAALASYRNALLYQPHSFKWEWAFARLHYADLAAREGLAALPEPNPLAPVLRSSWHAPRSLRAVDALGREPRPGDLHMEVSGCDEGPRVFRASVILTGS